MAGNHRKLITFIAFACAICRCYAENSLDDKSHSGFNLTSTPIPLNVSSSQPSMILDSTLPPNNARRPNSRRLEDETPVPGTGINNRDTEPKASTMTSTSTVPEETSTMHSHSIEAEEDMSVTTSMDYSISTENSDFEHNHHHPQPTQEDPSLHINRVNMSTEYVNISTLIEDSISTAKSRGDNGLPVGHETNVSVQERTSLSFPERQNRSEGRSNLCSTCLCDKQQKKIICKQEHLYDGKSTHLTLRQELIPLHATSLAVEDFETVTITEGTFSNPNLELRIIRFENIGQMRLSTRSLFFSSKAPDNREVAIIFKHCTIEELPTGAITQQTIIQDQNNDIGVEETRFLTLIFESCSITNIRQYAIHQARILQFNFSHTKVSMMEEHSFHIDSYDEWSMEKCVLPHMGPNTICLRSQSVVVFSDCIMAGLGNHSLQILSNSQVLFEYNKVAYLGAEALLGIVPNTEARGANIVFLNNTITQLEKRSLVTSRKYPLHERKVLNNKFNIICTCNLEASFQDILGITDASDHYDNTTLHSVLEKSLCQTSYDRSVYKPIGNYLDHDCSPMPIPIIASVSAVAIVIVITVVICIICNRRVQKAKDEANYLGECCYSNSFSTLQSNLRSPPYSKQCHSWERSQTGQPWVVAVPEVKTYQETEVHILYEHTDPLNASIRGSYHESPIDFTRKAQSRASCPFN